MAANAWSFTIRLNPRSAFLRTRAVAMELAEPGIGLNAVASGPIETERTAKTFEDVCENQRLQLTNFGVDVPRGEPDEIATRYWSLCQTGPSFITGTLLSVACSR